MYLAEGELLLTVSSSKNPMHLEVGKCVVAPLVHSK